MGGKRRVSAVAKDGLGDDAERLVRALLSEDAATAGRRRRRRASVGDEGTEATETLELPKSLRVRDLERVEATTSARGERAARRAESSEGATNESRSMNTSDCARNAAMFADAIGCGDIAVDDPYRALARRAAAANVGGDRSDDADDSKALVVDVSSLMKGVHACFINIPSKRADALGRTLERMGGSVATSAADDGVTHVVASERNAPLTKALELIALEDVITITPEWITESYKQNRALPVDAPEFAPRVLIRALPDRPHSQDTETSSEAERKALAARERKEHASAVAVRRSEGFGVVWTSDLVDHEKLEASRKFFSCQPSEQNAKAMPLECNSKVADLLSEMAKINQDALREVYKAKQYAAAASALRSLNFEVQSIDQVDVIPMLKKRDGKIRKYVQEILTTGKLTALQSLRQRPDVKSCVELSGIHGVGPVTARKLFDKGYKSLADLRAPGVPRDTLTPTQWIGLKYYEEFKQRIPREEVSHIATAVREAANTFMKDEVRCYCVGSFRRGKADSGDVDVLVECRDVSLANDLLMHILNDLRAGSPSPRSGILTDDLQVGDVQYMGVAALQQPLRADDQAPPVHRRIDIKVYETDAFPTALLYFTGSDKFNRSMRLWAKRKGYALQDKGLFRDRSEAAASRVRVRDEKDIFDALQLDYVAPKDRNV